MSDPRRTAPPIRKYRLVSQDTLAGKWYKLATEDGEVIQKQVKRASVPGYPEDPRVSLKDRPVLSVRVLNRYSDEEAREKIERRIGEIDHAATVYATIRGTDYEWHVSDEKVVRVQPQPE